MPIQHDREPYQNLTRSMDAVVGPFAGGQRSTFGEWLRVVSASTSVVLQFQRAGLEGSLGVVNAIGEANRQVLDAWLGTALPETVEISSSDAERAAQQGARQAERVAEAVDEPRQRESGARPTITVLKREDDWAVVRDSASRASGVFQTRREAVERARQLARRDHAEVHVSGAADGERTNGQRSGREQKPARGAKRRRA